MRRRSVELLYRADIEVTRAPLAGEILRSLGYEARVVVEREIVLAPDRIVFAGGNPLWYRNTMRRVAALPPDERPAVIVWHTEPLPMPAAAGLPREPLTAREVVKIALRDRRVNDHASNGRYLRELAGEGIVTVFAVATGAYQAYLAEHGVPAELVPLGYDPDDGRLLHLERDIDVLFLGDYRIRRRRHILRQLQREGIDLLVLGSNSASEGYWGESRTELLNRTKILLNLPRLQGHLPDIRLIVAMADGALVVSEPMYLPAPYVPGTHYVESPAEELAATVRRYLAEEEERRRITDAAHAFVTHGLTLEGTFARLLELAEAATVSA